MKQKTAPTDRRQATDTGDGQTTARKGGHANRDSPARGRHDRPKQPDGVDTPTGCFFHATKQEQPTTATTDTGHPAPRRQATPTTGGHGRPPARVDGQPDRPPTGAKPSPAVLFRAIFHG